jgi:membrane protein YdbS with pleckstrin-like domain
MSGDQVIGTRGFVAWFYAVVYNRILAACKNIFVKISMHLIGLIAIVVGLYFLILTMPSIASVGGLVLLLIGLVVFVIPFGTKK